MAANNNLASSGVKSNEAGNDIFSICLLISRTGNYLVNYEKIWKYSFFFLTQSLVQSKFERSENTLYTQYVPTHQKRKFLHYHSHLVRQQREKKNITKQQNLWCQRALKKRLLWCKAIHAGLIRATTLTSLELISVRFCLLLIVW